MNDNSLFTAQVFESNDPSITGTDYFTSYNNRDIDSYEGVEKIDNQELINKIELRRGGFGDVWKAQWGTLAVVIKYPYVPSELGIELRNMQKVAACDRVVKFHGITQNTDKKIGLVMHYCANGTLREYLKSNKDQLTWPDKFTLAEEIALGLGFIHQTGLLHRDLHSNNILIDDGHAFLADFGLSRDVDRSQTSSNVGGVAAFIPPERLRGERGSFTKKGDIYSLGVVYWEISSAKVPFETMNSNAVALAILEGKREEPIAETPETYLDLYSKCWADKMEDRPDLSYVLRALKAVKEGTTPPLCSTSEPVSDTQPQEVIARTVRKRRLKLVVALGVTCVVAAVLGVSVAAAVKALGYNHF